MHLEFLHEPLNSGNFPSSLLLLKLWLHAQFLHAIILDSGLDF